MKSNDEWASKAALALALVFLFTGTASGKIELEEGVFLSIQIVQLLKTDRQ